MALTRPLHSYGIHGFWPGQVEHGERQGQSKVVVRPVAGAFDARQRFGGL